MSNMVRLSAPHPVPAVEYRLATVNAGVACNGCVSYPPSVPSRENPVVSRDKRAAWLVRFALPYFCTTFSPPFGTGGISAAGSLKGKRRSRYTLILLTFGLLPRNPDGPSTHDLLGSDGFWCSLGTCTESLEYSPGHYFRVCSQLCSAAVRRSTGCSEANSPPWNVSAATSTDTRVTRHSTTIHAITGQYWPPVAPTK